MTTTTNAG